MDASDFDARWYKVKSFQEVSEAMLFALQRRVFDPVARASPTLLHTVIGFSVGGQVWYSSELGRSFVYLCFVHFFPLLPPGLVALMTLARSAFHGFQIGFKMCKGF